LYQGWYWTNVETWNGAKSDNYNGDLQNNGADLLVARDVPDGYYAINLFDTYGDGMCCDNGNGSFVLKQLVNEQEENVIASVGNFRSHKSVEFLIDNGTVQLTTAMDEEKNEMIEE
jgi:hypothetical protein